MKRSEIGWPGRLSAVAILCCLWMLGALSGQPSLAAQNDQATITLPGTTILVGEEADLALTLKLPDGLLYALDAEILYDPDVVEATRAVKGALTQAWEMVVNLAIPGTVRIAMAGAQPVDGDGELLRLSFRAVGAAGTNTDLYIQRADLNEGAITSATTHGALYVVEAAALVVTLTANPLSGGTVTGQGAYEQGAEVTVQALPNQGYTFENWTENGTEVSTEATYVFTLASNRDLVANFTPASHTVTFRDHDGTELKTEEVEHGGSATPPVDPTREGYTFTGWDTDFSNVTSDLTVTAQYAINYTLTVTDGTGGGQYPVGQAVTITANAPAEGKVFDQWTGGVAHVAEVNNTSTTVTMPAENITVTATYKDAPADTFALTVNNGEGSGQYEEGASVPIVADPPADGKVFDRWTGDVATVRDAKDASTTLIMPARNIVVTAEYRDRAPDKHALTVQFGSCSGE